MVVTNTNLRANELVLEMRETAERKGVGGDRE